MKDTLEVEKIKKGEERVFDFGKAKEDTYVIIPSDKQKYIAFIKLEYKNGKVISNLYNCPIIASVNPNNFEVLNYTQKDIDLEMQNLFFLKSIIYTKNTNRTFR